MSNAPARVTVFYRVQVVTTHANSKTTTRTLKHHYKTKAGAQRAVLKHSDMFGSDNKIRTAHIIEHTASTPLH